MNMKNEFLNLMQLHTEIALATSVENIPNVRIVNFVYNEERQVLYFSSFEKNEKVKEFVHNNKVAFTTVPHSGNAHVRGKGIVQKSERTIYDVADAFGSKIKDYDKTIEMMGKLMVLYEIHFKKALIILDFDKKGIVEV